MSLIFGNWKYILNSKLNSNIIRRTWVSHLLCKRSSSYYRNRLTVSHFVVPHRTYVWGGLSRKPSEEKFKKIDEIPEGFELIYRTSSYQYFKWGYLLACVASSLVLGILFFRYDFERTQIYLTNDTPEHMSNEVIFFMSVFCALFIVVQGYATRVPMRIYNLSVQKKYILVFNGGIPLTLRKITCYKGEVVKSESAGSALQFLPWNKCGYLLTNSQKIYLFEDSFRKPSDFHVLLGYQDDFE